MALDHLVGKGLQIEIATAAEFSRFLCKIATKPTEKELGELIANVEELNAQLVSWLNTNRPELSA